MVDERQRPDRSSVQRRAALLSAFAFALALLVSAAWSARELEHANRLRDKLHLEFQTRSALEDAYRLVQAAETAQRGYVITNNPRFLEPFSSAERRIEGQLRRLEALLDAERERQGAERLRRLIDAKFFEMRRVLELKATRGQDAAQAEIAAGLGAALMDDIRDEARTMRAHQGQEIDRLLVEDERRRNQTAAIIAALFMTLAASGIAAGFFVRGYMRARHALIGAYAEEASRQRILFDAALDGILVIGPDDRIEAANRAAEDLLGAERGGLKGAAAADLVTGVGDTLAVRLGLDGDRARAGARREATGVRLDGSTFPIEVSLVASRREEDPRAVAYVRDIADLQEVARLKDEFVSTVSHELRTPLTSIAGSLGLIAGGAAGQIPDKARRLVTIAQSNSQRLVRLINDVLDMNKLESGKMPFHMIDLSLRDVALRSIDGVRGYADQVGVEIELAGGDDIPVRGDVDRLIQVATNLLSNALRFSPRGGLVTVEVVRDEGRARLSVIDRGPGVPESFRDRIFTRFAQADASNARGKSGTGLGLYIAREIAERHGGRLWYQSPPEGGARFNLDLPALEAAPRRAPRDRLLLVEDEPAAAALLVSILEADGLNVETAATLEEARAQLKDADRFGALVLDLRLPDGDGMELVRELRNREDTRAIPIVIVSGDRAREREPEVRALEVMDWMEKPVDPDRLSDLVRGAVSRAAPGARLILHVDDDRDIREVVAASVASLGEVVSAESLAEARQILAEREPDLVILDLELRDGLGLDLLPDLENRPGGPIPVVVFSAQDATEDLGATVAAVLVKSRTSLQGLVGAIRSLVDTGASA